MREISVGHEVTLYALSLLVMVPAIYLHNPNCYLIGVLIFVVAFIFTIRRGLISPFIHPYYEKYFDVSGKRKSDAENMIEQFICDGGFTELQVHFQAIAVWKSECELRIQKSLLKKRRRKQFEQVIDDTAAFHFYNYVFQYAGYAGGLTPPAGSGGQASNQSDGK